MANVVNEKLGEIGVANANRAGKTSRKGTGHANSVSPLTLDNVKRGRGRPRELGDEPVSLAPLAYEDALRGLLEVKPSPTVTSKQRPQKKRTTKRKYAARSAAHISVSLWVCQRDNSLSTGTF
jgi:hypothetical protein